MPKMKRFPVTDAQTGEFIGMCMVIPRCAECGEPLTDEENLDDQTICNDCLQDFIRQKLEEHRHPDNVRGAF